MSTKELNISPVGRVEGDLDVKVFMEGGVVTRAHTQAAMFRGFEKIMEGKDPQSGLIATPRICGICGGSHLYCASSALATSRARIKRSRTSTGINTPHRSSLLYS